MHIQKKICPTCAMDVRMDYLPGTYILKCPNCERMETISGTIISYGKNRWPADTHGSDKDPAMPDMADLESVHVKVLVDEIVRSLPVADVMDLLTARFPDAAIADLCMAYAKLLIWARETSTPHQLLSVTKVYHAAGEPLEEHVFKIGCDTPCRTSGTTKFTVEKGSSD